MACRSVLVGLAQPQREPRTDSEALPQAVIFDLDAIADLDCAGIDSRSTRRSPSSASTSSGPSAVPAAAALSDERRRVAAELRKRGVRSDCDVLAELLVDDICARKNRILAETILDAGQSPAAPAWRT